MDGAERGFRFLFFFSSLPIAAIKSVCTRRQDFSFSFRANCISTLKLEEISQGEILKLIYIILFVVIFYHYRNRYAMKKHRQVFQFCEKKIHTSGRLKVSLKFFYDNYEREYAGTTFLINKITEPMY